MKILYLSPRDCWPTDTGARLRDYHLVRQLRRRHEVTYVGFAREGAGVQSGTGGGDIPGLEGMETVLIPRSGGYRWGNLARGVVGPRAFPVLQYQQRAMREKLRELLRGGEFHAVQIEGVHLAGYLDLFDGMKVMCDWHNIESELMRRYSEGAPSVWHGWYARRTAGLLERAEDELLERCSGHTVCSGRERDLLLRRTGGKARIQVVANGVDTTIFSDGELERAAKHYAGPEPGVRHIGFVGSMDYHANIDAAQYLVREVWPLIREKHPDLRLYLVGARPGASVQALADGNQVVVTGTVEDVRPYYRNTAAILAPLRVGGGTRLKILEAMAAGAPVVATPLGAEGLNPEHGKTLLLGDRPEELAKAVLFLLENPEQGRQLGAQAREWVKAHYDWAIPGEALLEAYTEWTN